MEVTSTRPENQAQKRIPSLAYSTERDISIYQIRSLHPLANPAGFLSRGAFHSLAAVFV